MDKDITIIGGGIIGLCSALSLSRHYSSPETKDAKISIIERSQKVGSESSSVAGYGIRTVYRNPINLYLAQKGLRFWSNINSDIGFRQNGYLFLTDSKETYKKLSNLNRIQEMNGLPSHISDTVKISDYTDEDIRNFKFCLFSPVSAVADSEDSIRAVHRMCKEKGVEIRTNESVNMISDNEDKCLIETSKTTESVDCVVNAAGIWSGDIASYIGDELPVGKSERKLAITDKQVRPDTPLTVDIDSGFYMLPNKEGKLVIGGHFNTTEDYRTVVKQKASDMYNTDFISQIDNVRFGNYALTPSRVPIIEKSGNVYHICGFSGHGVMQAPGASIVLTRIITESDNSILNRRYLSSRRNKFQKDIQF